MAGPSRPSAQDSTEVISLVPPGVGGVDLFTHPASLPPEVLARSENCRNLRGPLERREGVAKLYQPSDPCGSKTFGTDAKYATIPSAAQLLLPKGGFGFKASFVATRPASGKTAYLIASLPLGLSEVFWVTLSDAGVVTAAFRDTGGNVVSVASTAQTQSDALHLLALLDPILGTWTLYLNGRASGTPASGLSSTIQPIQTPSVIWSVGVEKETGAGVTADTLFPGAIDALTLFQFQGQRLGVATTAGTLANMLLRHSGRQWPTPQQDMVLFNYDMDKANEMVDSSRYKNDASLVGTPTNTAAVAKSTMAYNFIGSFDTPQGARTNVIGNAGRLFWQKLRANAA